jgi:hypothetical protein
VWRPNGNSSVGRSAPMLTYAIDNRHTCFSPPFLLLPLVRPVDIGCEDPTLYPSSSPSRRRSVRGVEDRMDFLSNKYNPFDFFFSFSLLTATATGDKGTRDVRPKRRPEVFHWKLRHQSIHPSFL